MHPEHVDASDAVSSEYSGKKFTVLLVEDNVDLLNLTRESLAEWFRVLRASNGLEALEVLAQENVDVIVSDVMMPEMDGLELCCKVKSEISYSHIPVILLTAKTTLESKVEGLDMWSRCICGETILYQTASYADREFAEVEAVFP